MQNLTQEGDHVLQTITVCPDGAVEFSEFTPPPEDKPRMEPYLLTIRPLTLKITAPLDHLQEHEFKQGMTVYLLDPEILPPRSITPEWDEASKLVRKVPPRINARKGYTACVLVRRLSSGSRPAWRAVPLAGSRTKPVWYEVSDRPDSLRLVYATQEQATLASIAKAIESQGKQFDVLLGQLRSFGVEVQNGPVEQPAQQEQEAPAEKRAGKPVVKKAAQQAEQKEQEAPTAKQGTAGRAFNMHELTIDGQVQRLAGQTHGGHRLAIGRHVVSGELKQDLCLVYDDVHKTITGHHYRPYLSEAVAWFCHNGVDPAVAQAFVRDGLAVWDKDWAALHREHNPGSPAVGELRLQYHEGSLYLAGAMLANDSSCEPREEHVFCGIARHVTKDTKTQVFILRHGKETAIKATLGDAHTWFITRGLTTDQTAWLMVEGLAFWDDAYRVTKPAAGKPFTGDPTC